MPKKSKEQEQYFIAIIRRIMIQKPGIGCIRISKELTELKNPLKLSKDYVNKLMRKIDNERKWRAKSYLQIEFIAKLQDRLTEVDRYLWAILNSSTATAGERLGAARELRENYKTLMDKLETAGIFTDAKAKIVFNYNDIDINNLDAVSVLGLLERMDKFKNGANAITSSANIGKRPG